MPVWIGRRTLKTRVGMPWMRPTNIDTITNVAAILQSGLPAVALAKAGRLRLCPYYFVVGGKARLSGALATFCPPDKKIIHGMVDAALLPSRVLSLS